MRQALRSSSCLLSRGRVLSRFRPLLERCRKKESPAEQGERNQVFRAPNTTLRSAQGDKFTPHHPIGSPPCVFVRTKSRPEPCYQILRRTNSLINRKPKPARLFFPSNTFAEPLIPANSPPSFLTITVPR